MTVHPSQEQALEAFRQIMGAEQVLTSERATGPYSKGYRFGGGPLLAVLRPTSLVQIWRALQICLDHNLMVIPQASNTGLTGGSGPGFQDYDRPIVLISTHLLDQVHLLHGGKEAVSLAGASLIQLTQALGQVGREPHSVIGSTSIGASVVGGIANNSGGSQIRKGPAFSRQAIFARVNAGGQLELVNHLGIDLGQEPEEILTRLERGDWPAEAVSPAPEDSGETEYATHLRKLEPSPARDNADPQYLFEASGSAGKIMVFAVRTRSFPLEQNPTMFYIGTPDPRELEEIRRLFLAADMPLPISAEYMGRSAFDLAEKYGKDTYVFLKYLSPTIQTRMFAFKTWANGVFSKVPGLSSTFADTVSQRIFDLVPNQLPQRLMDYRNRFEHHLMLTVSAAQSQQAQELLGDFFSQPGRRGDFFTCDQDEMVSTNLHRFGAASAATRYAAMQGKQVAGLIPIDVALRRDDWDWLEVLPPEIADQLEVAAYYGHFFCHVLHQDYVAKQGVDPDLLHDQIQGLLEDRGAKLPAEHNYGRLYHMPPQMVEHFKELDPTNTFNAGIGGTSPRKNWT